MKKLRILLVMDPGIPVPPEGYGGHERLVHLFATEYARMGHIVSLLAGPGSSINGRVFAFGKNDLARGSFQRAAEVVAAWRFILRNRREYDVIHNFGRLIYLLPILNTGLRKIMTYGRHVSKRGIRIVTGLPNQHLLFTACSDFCVSTGNVSGRWETVYNAIDFSAYTLQHTVPDHAPLMFLGRLDRVKGAHHAIAAARKMNRTLWIAGNIPATPDNLRYYREEVEPHIDGQQVVYLGELGDEQKNDFLGKAAALLFPIGWDEPFGLVMAEALACGTPVIAFRRGSVPEIIRPGENGFIVDDEAGMCEAIGEIRRIDRARCRIDAEQRFNANVIAERYLNLMNDA